MLTFNLWCYNVKTIKKDYNIHYYNIIFKVTFAKIVEIKTTFQNMFNKIYKENFMTCMIVDNKHRYLNFRFYKCAVKYEHNYFRI